MSALELPLSQLGLGPVMAQATARNPEHDRASSELRSTIQALLGTTTGDAARRWLSRCCPEAALRKGGPTHVLVSELRPAEVTVALERTRAALKGKLLADELVSSLSAARDLLADPSRWIRDAGGGWAVDVEGMEVEEDDPAAVQWELLGAVRRHVRPSLQRAAEELLADQIAPAPRALQAWMVVEAWSTHEDREHAEVLEKLELAILAATWRPET